MKYIFPNIMNIHIIENHNREKGHGINRDMIIRLTDI